jgi:thiol-disulfide isomerase/thioredoxin
MRTILIIILFAGLVFPQSKLTEKDKEFGTHIKQVWAGADKSNYQKNFSDLLVECDKYLKDHPQTAIKAGILGYVFEMTAAISSDPNEVIKAANVLLENDNSLKTNMRVAQILIEKKFDDKRGVEILKRILPQASNGKEYYDANLLLASGELHLKNYQSSVSFLNDAIRSDSTKVDGYKALVEVLPLAGREDEVKEVKAKLKTLENDPNIGVDLSSLSFSDINENKIDLNNFKGSIVTMVFFRFECPYCRKELPIYKELIKEHPEIKFIFIDLDENVQDIKLRYLKEDQFSFMRDHTIAKFVDIFDNILDITITPQTLIIDKNSVIEFDYRGYKEDFADKFEKDIKSLK